MCVYDKQQKLRVSHSVCVIQCHINEVIIALREVRTYEENQFFDTFSARVNYRKMSLKPRNLRGQQLNPVFHFHTKKEDNNEFSHSLIKNARKTGCLKLAGRGLSSGMAIIIVMIVLNACVCMCIVCVCVRCFCFGSPFDR